jgi:hypothetical protein
MPFNVESTEKIVSIVASCASTLAIIVGGIFAWWRWGREAPSTRRGELTHNVVYSFMSDSHRLIHVTLNLKNVGSATLSPVEGYTKIFQVLALPSDFAARLLDGSVPLGVTKTEFDWPCIGRRDYPLREDDVRIDSGESETYGADFIIPAGVSAVFVYSMACLDPEDSDLGWDVTTFHEFPAKQDGSRMEEKRLPTTA